MRLIDRIALNRLINTIVNLILSLAKIFAKSESKIDTTVKPSKPRVIKKITDKIINILPRPWGK